MHVTFESSFVLTILGNGAYSNVFILYYHTTLIPLLMSLFITNYRLPSPNFIIYPICSLSSDFSIIYPIYFFLQSSIWCIYKPQFRKVLRYCRSRFRDSDLTCPTDTSRGSFCHKDVIHVIHSPPPRPLLLHSIVPSLVHPVTSGSAIKTEMNDFPSFGNFLKLILPLY